jgi:hypothetical protein
MKNLELEALAKKYGITLKSRIRRTPKPVNLSSEKGQRLFWQSVKRVMETHARVIEALAER